MKMNNDQKCWSKIVAHIFEISVLFCILVQIFEIWLIYVRNLLIRLNWIYKIMKNQPCSMNTLRCVDRHMIEIRSRFLL